MANLRETGGNTDPELMQPLSLIRPDDALVLHLEFVNLSLRPGGANLPPVLQAANPKEIACLIAHFPAQHLAEASFADPPGDGPTPGPAPVGSRLSGPSRLVFELTAGKTLPYTLRDLLDWGPQSVLQSRQVPATRAEADIGQPSELQSAIEAPYRLVISPDPGNGWQTGELTQKVGQQRTYQELWHARLVAADSQDDPSQPAIRAVWSPDYPGADAQGEQDEGFATSLRAHYRDLIHRTHRADLEPAPVPAHHLMLSPMGAWLDLDGPDQPGPDSVSLARWVHRAAMGQDERVVTETKGFILPTGHPAVSVTVTTREFAPDGDGATGAYLRTRHFIRIRQPQVHLDGESPMPFRSVRVLDRATPALPVVPDEPAYYWITLPAGPEADTPIDFRFRGEAEDWDGQTCTFSFAAMFMRSDADMQAALQAYNGAPDDRRLVPLSAQPVAVAAPIADGVRSDTQVELQALRLLAAPRAQSVSPGQAPFAPAADGLQARLPALKSLVGDDANLDWFDLPPDPKVSNAAALFLIRREGGQPIGVRFADQGSKIGGLVLPDFDVAGVARKIGPVGDVAAFSGQEFVPENYFHAEATLLGQVPLWAALTHRPDGEGAALPSFQLSLDPQAGEDAPRKLKIEWETTQLRSASEDGTPTQKASELKFLTRQEHPELVPDPDQDTRLSLCFEATSAGDGGVPSAQAQGSLSNYTEQHVLATLPTGPESIRIRMKSITLSAGTGSSPNLQTEIDQIELVGFLLGAVQFLLRAASVTARKKNETKGRTYSVTVSPSPQDIKVTLAFAQGPGKEPEKPDPDPDPDAGVGVDAHLSPGSEAGIARPQGLVQRVGEGDDPPPEPEVPEEALQWGNFLLYNLGVSFSIKVFFFRHPVEFGVNLASPTKPFFVTSVGSIWGGGGSLGFAADSKQLQTLSFSLQAGAIQFFDLGSKAAPVRASVIATAGFVLTYHFTTKTLTFTIIFAIAGGVKLSSWLSVSLSILFTLTPKQIEGRLDFLGTATISLEITIASFFTLSFSHTFKGHIRGPQIADSGQPATLGNADEPVISFAQLMPQADWLAYQQAFAQGDNQ